MFPVTVFCVVLAVLQQMQGTTLIFTGCTVVFVLLATLAFNLSGGLTRPSGAFLCGYAGVGVLFGIVFKVFVGEAGQSNLLQPELTIEVYVATIAAMLLCAYLNRRFRPKKALVPKFASAEAMNRSAVGCFIVGALPSIWNMVSASAAHPGIMHTVLGLLSNFLPLAVLLGVTAEIQLSGGRRSINTVAVLALLLSFAQGVITYSKAGVYYGFLAWAVPAAAQRYKVSLTQIAAFCLAVTWVTYYLVPYCQYGRNFRDESASLSETLKVNLLLLSNLGQVRKVYLQNSADLYTDAGVSHYYNEPQPLAERTQMITPDDAIINLTVNGEAYGLLPTLYSIYNIVPHVIWPNKPSANFGTVYAHELGILSEDDETTGISFSPSGDAFHQAKWVGVLVVLPLLVLVFFYTNDAVMGDVREAPIGLATVLALLHAAQEGGIVQFAVESTTVVTVIYLVGYVSTRIMPVVANMLIKPRDQSFVQPLQWRPMSIADEPKSPLLPYP